MQSSEQIQSPIDDQTYDLLQILTSKLEAIEAYDVYQEDLSGDASRIVEEIARDDRQHVNKLAHLLGISGDKGRGGQR